MALSPSLSAQMTQLPAQGSEVQQVKSPTLQMLMASPEEQRVNEALGALTFLGGGTGGGTVDTGGAALGAIPTGAGSFILGDVGGAGASPDGSFPAPQAGGESVRGFDDMLDPGQDVVSSLAAGLTGQGDAGDASDAGAGSVAGGSTADVSPADVAGAAIGGIGPGGISIGHGQSPGVNVGLTGTVGVNTGVPGLNAGLNAVGVPTGTSLAALLSSIAPAAAHALGVAGLGVGAFQGAVGIAGALANAMGIPTANTMAQEGHPAGLAATGQLAGMGISPEGVFSDPDGVAGVPGGYAAVLGANSPLGPQGSYVSLSADGPLGGLSAGRVGGSPSLAGLGIDGGLRGSVPDPAPNPDAPLPGLHGGPLGGPLGDPEGGPGGVPGGEGGPAGGGSGAGGGSAAGPSGDASDAEHTGGLITDKQRRPGGEERRTLLEGEYVIRPSSTKKYRRLLEAINQDRPQQVSRLARALGG